MAPRQGQQASEYPNVVTDDSNPRSSQPSYMAHPGGVGSGSSGNGSGAHDSEHHVSEETRRVSDPNSSDYDRQSSHYDQTIDPRNADYIHPASTGDTGSEVHDTHQHSHEQQVDAKVNEINQMLGPFARAVDDGLKRRIAEQMVGPNQANKQIQQELSQQAKRLAQGLRTRPAPPMPNSVYGNVEHKSLYDMVNDNAHPSNIGTRADLWTKTGNQMVNFQDTVAKAINNSEADWSGAAGDSARTFMAKVGNWVGESGQGSALTGTQMSLHAEALSTAKNSVPKPPDKPFDIDAANADLQATTNPMAMMTKRAEYIATMNKQQADQQEAARVVQNYDNTLGGATTTPAFSPPPRFSGGGGGHPGEIEHKKVGGGGNGNDNQLYKGGGSGNSGGGSGGGSVGGSPVGGIPGGGSGGGVTGGSGGGGGGANNPVGNIPRPGAVVGSGTNPQSNTGAGSIPGGAGAGRFPDRGGAGGMGAIPGGMPIGGGFGGGFGGGDTVRGGGGLGAGGFGPRGSGSTGGSGGLPRA
ncbi:MAG: hypothetical protein ACRDQ5_24355, partial [Sciscionella sp.]